MDLGVVEEGSSCESAANPQSHNDPEQTGLFTIRIIHNQDYPQSGLSTIPHDPEQSIIRINNPTIILNNLSGLFTIDENQPCRPFEAGHCVAVEGMADRKVPAHDVTDDDGDNDDDDDDERLTVQRKMRGW